MLLIYSSASIARIASIAIIGSYHRRDEARVGAQDDQDDQGHKVLANSVERQTQLMPYKGTFDDFNDRVIQFGYLVLFSPAFPLAPLLAFANNVIEIRTAGYKMCRGKSTAPKPTFARLLLYAYWSVRFVRLNIGYQRPEAKSRSGIGSWFVVLAVLGASASLQ